MDELKLDIGKILELEKLIFYIDNVDKVLINLNNNLDGVSIKYVNDINSIDKYLIELNNSSLKVVNYKFDIDRNIEVQSKFKLIYIFITIFLLIFGICFENVLIVSSGIIMIIVCLIIYIYNFFERSYYFYTFGKDYSNSLEEYLKLQKNVEKIYANGDKDRGLLEKYQARFDIYKHYKLFSIKYFFFKNYYDKFKKELEYLRKTILDKEKDIYKDINVDKMYQNYLSMSVFYEYLKKNNFDTLDDMYTLYKKEYGFIINESKSTIFKFSNNKLSQEYDNNKLLLINDIFNKVSLCIADSTYNIDDLVCLIIKFNAEFYKSFRVVDIDEMANGYLKSSGIKEYYVNNVKKEIKNKYK